MTDGLDVTAFTSPAMPNVGGDGEEETTTDSQPENEPEDTEEKDGGKVVDKGDEPDKPVPFHQHPRWIEREKQWNAKLDNVQQATAKEIETLKSQIGTRQAEQKEMSDDDIPEWFNGDLGTYKKFHGHQTKMIQDAVKAAEGNVLNKLKEDSGKETKAIGEATDWFRSELSRIESDATLNPSGEALNQTELLTIARDNDLIDSGGRWNWAAAARIYAKEHKTDEGDEQAKQKQTAKNNIAALTSKKDSKGGASQKTIASSDSLKGKGWDNL